MTMDSVVEHVLAEGEDPVTEIMFDGKLVEVRDEERDLSLVIGYSEPEEKYKLKVERYMFDQLKEMQPEQWKPPPEIQRQTAVVYS